MSAATAQAAPRGEIKAAWTRYAIVTAGLAVLVLTILIVIWPELLAVAVCRILLPGYETEFGFHGGMIRPPNSEYSVYGIASVVPGGRLDRAGVRAGDIPVEYPGGMMSFYYALKAASQGREGTFSVATDLQAWREDHSLARHISVAPK